MSDKMIKICPKCGSDNLSFDSMSLGELSISNGNMTQYCIDCLYGQYVYGALFLDVKIDDLEKVRKEIHDNNSQN